MPASRTGPAVTGLPRLYFTTVPKPNQANSRASPGPGRARRSAGQAGLAEQLGRPRARGQLLCVGWIVLTDPEGNEFCRRAVRLPPACSGPGWPLLPCQRRQATRSTRYERPTSAPPSPLSPSISAAPRASCPTVSITHRDGHCWGRPGCRGTTRGTGTSRTSVQCVLSGHSLAASVQVERPERPVGPLLIRGFGVRVPGGAPVPTSTKPCRQPGSLLCRGANRSAASLHTLPTAHHRRTRTVILPGWLPRRACVRRRPRTAGAAASRLRCAGKQIDYESEMPIRSSPMVSLFHPELGVARHTA